MATMIGICHKIISNVIKIDDLVTLQVFIHLGKPSFLKLGTGVEELSGQTGKFSYPIHKVQ